MVEIGKDVVEVKSSTASTISAMPNVEVDTSKTKTVQINPNNFVLSSGGIYSKGGIDGQLPQWLLDAIQQQLTTGDGNVMSVLADMQILLGQLDVGVSQAISRVQNAEESISSLETSVVSRLDGNDSTILDIQTTKVDATQALAISANAIQSTFGNDASAFVGNIVSTYASANLATAGDYDLITATLNGATASISTIENVTITAINDDISIITDVLIPELQSQIDGAITTWFDDYTPSNANEPWMTWNTIDIANGNDNEKIKHLGDIFYDTSTGYGYRFTFTTVYGWGVITDAAITDALYLASQAQGTADAKRVIYGGATIPIGSVEAPLDTNDMWIPSADNGVYVQGKIYLYNKVSLEWNDATRYTDNQYAEDIVNGTNQIDLSQHIDSLGWNTSINTLQTDVSGINTVLVQTALDISNLDGAISAEEAARVQAILTEQTARASDIALRVAAEAVLDGLITAEEQARINAVSEVEVAYKEYSRIVTLAIADGVLTPEEQTVILAAQSAVDAAKARLLAIETNVTYIIDGTTSINLSTATVDGTKLLSAYVAEEIDKEVVVYSGTDYTTQTGMKAKDLYIESTTETASSGIVVDVVNTYKYNGATWDQINTNNNLTALADLTDGKRTVYGGTDVPINPEVNDIWIPETGVVGYVAKELYKYDGTTWTIPVKYTDDSSLDSFISVQYSQDLLDIGSQIDGKADSYFQDTEPYPEASGLAINTGDTWYNTSTRVLKVYRFSTLSWEIINDPTIQVAYDAASTAQATADGKITSFTGSTPPTNYFIGDIWLQGTTGDILVANADSIVYNASHWVIASKYEQAYTWSATASKFVTAPDGSITGWQVSDGSDQQSDITLAANRFRIVSSATWNPTTEKFDLGSSPYTPFEIDGTDIKFNGKVTFSSVTDGPTHTYGTTSPSLIVLATVPIGSTYYNTTTKEGFIVASTGYWILSSEVPDISNLALIDMSNVTTIDGGKITTGIIDASLVNVTNLNASNIKAGVIYNTGGSAGSYTMKIDLDNGLIHIK